MADIIVANGHGVGEYCNVKKIPVVGETVRASNRRFEEDAGKGTNAAVAIARMGGSVAFLGKAGKDEAGELGVKWMSEAGVDITYFWLDPDISTDLGLVLIADDGSNLCIDFDSDISNLQVEEADKYLPIMAKDARYVISGFSVSTETAFFVMKRGKELGLTTLLNPSPLVEGTYIPMLDSVDYLVINETEAKIIMDLPNDSQVEDYIALAGEIHARFHARNVVITLGPDGSVAYTPERSFAVPAKKTKMIDQTGAGDGFLAAITWRLSQGDDLETAMHWASIYCSYLVTQPGSLGSYPKKEIIEKIFAE